MYLRALEDAISDTKLGRKPDPYRHYNDTPPDEYIDFYLESYLLHILEIKDQN